MNGLRERTNFECVSSCININSLPEEKSPRCPGLSLRSASTSVSSVTEISDSSISSLSRSNNNNNNNNDNNNNNNNNNNPSESCCCSENNCSNNNPPSAGRGGELLLFEQLFKQQQPCREGGGSFPLHFSFGELLSFTFELLELISFTVYLLGASCCCSENSCSNNNNLAESCCCSENSCSNNNPPSAGAGGTLFLYMLTLGSSCPLHLNFWSSFPLQFTGEPFSFTFQLFEFISFAIYLLGASCCCSNNCSPNNNSPKVAVVRTTVLQTTTLPLLGQGGTLFLYMLTVGSSCPLHLSFWSSFPLQFTGEPFSFTF